MIKKQNALPQLIEEEKRHIIVSADANLDIWLPQSAIAVNKTKSDNSLECKEKMIDAFGFGKFQSNAIFPFQKRQKKKVRKILSTIEGTNQIVKLEVKSILKSRPRSKSISGQQPKINPLFQKECGCPGILVVDDQYINRYIILQYAEKYDINWAEAEDGLEAVNMVKEAARKMWCRGFHLILMDLNMPLMGGIEASKEILKLKSELQTSPNLSIIAVTAFVSEKERQKCFKAGMADFIPKPFKMVRFLSLVTLY
jgi:CheY-like chemotaxis protein